MRQVFFKRPTFFGMKKILFLLFMHLFFLGKSQILGQSGWTRNKGGIYAKAGFYTLNGSSYFNTEGVKIAPNTRSDFHQQALTFMASMALIKTSQPYSIFHTLSGKVTPTTNVLSVLAIRKLN
jgi:hypothetical protein